MTLRFDLTSLETFYPSVESCTGCVVRWEKVISPFGFVDPIKFEGIVPRNQIALLRVDKILIFP